MQQPAACVRTKIIVLLVFLLAWLLYLASWNGGSLHVDEALYAYWGRLIASGRDPALTSVRVDKPPFFLYTIALAFRSLGSTLSAARMPSIFASFLSLPVLFALADRLYGRSIAILTLAFFALTPFAISFAPTVFTDAPMVFWGLVACLMIVRGKWLVAGLTLGLAVATKQQGLLLVPLVLGFGWAKIDPHSHPLPPLGRWGIAPSPRSGEGHGEGGILRWRDLAGLLAGFGLIFAPVTWWDSLRWRTHPSFWQGSWLDYGGLHLTSPPEWGERLHAWATLWGYLAGPVWLAFILVLCLALILVAAWAARRRLTLAARVDLVLIGYCTCFLLLAFLVSLNPWDRYLLPLAPLVALILARGLALPINRLTGKPRRAYLVGLMLLFLSAIPTACLAAVGRLPLGSDHGAYAGLDRLAVWAQAALPRGATLYHHGLGWHLDYYLFDGGPEIRWYADGPALAEDMARRGRPAFLILASLAADSDVKSALAEEELSLRQRYAVSVQDSTVFTLYAVVEDTQP